MYPPDLKGRREIIEYYLSKIKIASGECVVSERLSELRVVH